MQNKKGKPIVSVLLPTYNWNEKWIRKSIESVYAQSYDNFELIIINDCSTNNIESIIKDYVEKYKNIIYIKNDKNLWLTKSLNIWIENSHWNYIARIDDDDYWISRDKLKFQVEFMEKYKEYWACWAWIVVHVDENDEELFTEYKNRLTDEQIRKDMLLQCWLTHSSVLIRKSALDAVWLYNPNYSVAQDYELWLRLWVKYKIINLSDISVAYREHRNNVSKSGNARMFRAIFSEMVRKNRHNYPNYFKAIILKIGVFILWRKFSLYIRRKLNPCLAVKNSRLNNNILLLNYEFPPIGWGGASVSYDIAKAYVDSWYNVDIITMGFWDLKQYEELDWICVYRVKCIRKKKESCQWWEQLTYLFSGYYKIKELLKNKKYSFCHCHFLLPTGILAIILKNFFWIKYIATAHWSDVPWHNPDRFTFIHKFTPSLLKRIINNSECITCPSQYLADLIKKNIPWINKSIEIIPNGIDTNRFVPLKKEKIIVSTWRLWPLKWIHLLAEAFSKIKDTKGFELHICWNGPLMKDIEEIQHNSKNKIVLYWWVNNNSKEYVELLWRAMIYCLPSVSESWSLSILEWMSSECTIITTNMWVCSEMAEGVWIYTEPYVESIKGKLEYCINNKKLSIDLWKKSRIKCVSNYEKNKLLWRYVLLCKRFKIM